MKQLNEKFRLIFLPYLVIALCCIAGYSFLHWLLVIKTGILSIPEDIANFWVPFLLPWIPLLIWLRPRLKLFNYKKGRDYFGLIMLPAFAIGFSLAFLQDYISTATGKLTELNTIQEINHRSATRYYSVKKFYIDKNNYSLKYTSDVSGKRSQDLNLHIYVVCPMYGSEMEPVKISLFDPNAVKIDVYNPEPVKNKRPLFLLDGMIIDSLIADALPKDSIESIHVLKGDSAVKRYGERGQYGVVIITSKRPLHINIPHAPDAWYCIQYKKRISNKLSEPEEKEKEDEFYTDCMEQFQKQDLRQFVYLDRVGNSEARKGYIKAIAKQHIAANEKQLNILEAVYKPFAERNGNKLPIALGVFAGISVIIFVVLLAFKFDDAKLKQFQQGITEKQTDAWDGLKLFVPKVGYYITPVLIDLNILIFLLMVFSGFGFVNIDGEALLQWGGNYGPLVNKGEWWRLVTSTFLHAGIMHVFANMVGLLFAGIFLEPVLGRRNYIIAYLVTGIAGSIASIYWHTATLSVGASGAVFGLYGLFLAFSILKIFPRALNRTFLIMAVVFIVYNLLMGIQGHVDNAAHIGGLLSGFVMGLFLAGPVKRKREEEGAGDIQLKSPF